MGARVAPVRELKAEIEALKAENAKLRDEASALKAHFDLALLAAQDLRDLPADGRLEIWDGWNLILGAKKEARDRADLIEQARQATAADPLRRIWIVFDGRDENVRSLGANVRVSYTGGTGAQRADRLIADFVRMARYLGRAGQVAVRTNDKDLRKTVASAGAKAS